MTVPNEALTAVCEAIEEWELSHEDQDNLIATLAEELEAREQIRRKMQVGEDRDEDAPPLSPAQRAERARKAAQSLTPWGTY